MSRKALLIGAMALSLVVAVQASPTTPRASAADHGPMFFGAYSKPVGGQTLQEAVEQLEAKTGRPMEVVREYLVWNEGFPTSFHTWLADTGRVPIISLKAKLVNGTKIPWSTIAAAEPGSAIHDQILVWAHKFRDYEVPFYFTFHHEPEIGENAVYGTSDEYIAAWRKVADIFRAEGVDNARYNFITTAWNYHVDPADRRYVPKWYPGDEYVDTIAADAYNWNNCLNPGNNGWRTLAQVIEPFRQWGATHPDKPLMLAEWGSVEHPTDPNGKADWIADARELLKQPAYSQIIGVAYFNSHRVANCTWQVDTTPQALASFSAMGADPFYAGAGLPTETGIVVSKTASPVSVVSPGDDVSFTIEVDNLSATHDALITGLDDDIYGNLDGIGSCSTPQTIAPGSSYACSFDEYVGGAAGDVHTDTVTAVGSSDGTAVSDSDSATVSVVAEPSGDVLFVVPNAASLNAGDSAIRSRLQGLGYTVIAVSASTASSGDATGKDLVLISSTVGEPAVGTKFTTVPEPVIIWKPWLYDAMEMSATNGANRRVAAIEIMNPGHPLAAGYDGATIILSPDSQVAVGTPAPGATVIATAAGEPTLFAFSPGDLLDNGLPAPGCRIGYPAFHTTPPNYTATGWAIFDNTITWATTGCDAGTGGGGIVVSKTASPVSVVSPGDDVSFTIEVDNLSATHDALITGLDDDIYGNLDGIGSCSTPQTIAPGSSYACSFDEYVGGAAGDVHTDTVTAVGSSDGTAVSDSDSATVSVVAEPSGDVLFVVPNAASLNAGDSAIRSRLQGLGYTVIAVSASTASSGDATGKDLVLISSTVGEPAVGTKFTTVPEPVIIWKPWLYDAMEMSATNGANRRVAAIEIMNPGHPLAAGYDGATIILSPDSQVAVGTPAPGATVIATAAGEPTLFAFSPGDLLDNGLPAPGCRIGYPAFHTTPPNYTATGWAIFDNTITWATTGCDPAP